MGAVNECIAHPREIFKSAILSNATSMILLHSHPSGNLNPSREDTVMTDRMLKLSELVGDTACGSHYSRWKKRFLF